MSSVLRATIAAVAIGFFVLLCTGCKQYEWSDSEYQHAITANDPSASSDVRPTDVQVRLFQPKARIYFDQKKNRSGRPELDVFDDGALVPTISLLELYWPKPYAECLGQKSWSWGPALGFGLSAPAQDSAGATASGGAPVLMLTLGFMTEIPVSDVRLASGKPAGAEAQLQGATKMGMEVGCAIGFSSDESLTDVTDTAIYAGFTFKF